MNKFFTTLFLVLSIGLLSAQEVSLGIQGGVIGYQGDLVDGPVDLKEINTVFGANFKYQKWRDLAITANINVGKISGDDANSERLMNRGLTFQSTLLEGTLQLEYHPFGRGGRYTRIGDFFKSISPFVFGGVGYAFTNPEVTGLPAGSTDLDNTITSRLVVPFGLGVQYTFNEFIYLGLEATSRYVPDDYLDGVSIEGNPNANDWYYSFGVRVGFYLVGEPSFF